MSIRKSLNNLNQRISDHRTLGLQSTVTHATTVKETGCLCKVLVIGTHSAHSPQHSCHTVNRSRRTLRVGGAGTTEQNIILL